MAITLKSAYTGQVGTSNTTIYTCPSSTKARVLKCTATNDTTSSVTLSVHKVISSETESDSNLIMNQKTIESKETYLCNEIVGHILKANEKITMIASAADQVTIAMSIAEVT